MSETESGKFPAWGEYEFGTPTLSVTIAGETIRLATGACDGQC